VNISDVSAPSSAAAAETSITLVKRVQDQQRLEGEAAVGLIEAAGELQEPSGLPRGDGTGTLVDVTVG